MHLQINIDLKGSLINRKDSYLIGEEKVHLHSQSLLHIHLPEVRAQSHHHLTTKKVERRAHYYKSIAKCAGKDFRDGAVVPFE